MLGSDVIICENSILIIIKRYLGFLIKKDTGNED